MDAWAVWLVAIALGADAFSLALSIGMVGVRKRKILSLTAAVFLFHILMPLGGIYLGAFLGRVVGRYAALAGALILGGIGLQMLSEGLRRKKGTAPALKFPALPNLPAVVSGALGVALLAGSVSLDALSVGFGLGAWQVNLLYTVMVMGTVAGGMTASGFFLGREVGNWLGQKAQAVGGLVLIGIGLRLLLA